MKADTGKLYYVLTLDPPEPPVSTQDNQIDISP